MTPEQVEVLIRPGVPGLIEAAECARVLAVALTEAGAPEEARITLTLSDDDELEALNGEHMGKAGPTDVLSFPLLPPSAFPAHAGQDPSQGTRSEAFPLPPGEVPHLGDIIISVERAAEQAREGHGGQASDRTWAPANELRLLIIHGGLHICGWDHAEPAEEAAMRELERRLLESGGDT